MNEPFPLHTHIAPSVAGPTFNATPRQDSTNIQADEPEDYTIKCICGFEEDDGNTVYCDTCDTWQHTECYYIDEHGAVPTNDDLKKYDHFCADCQPRPLDKKGAIERQRDRRKELDPGDRKVKKPASKSHKKKVRMPEASGPLTNGWAHSSESDFYDRTSRSPRDPHPPAKRSKTSHRFSHSMNVSVLPSNPTSHPHKRSSSTIYSPSKAYGKYSAHEIAKETYSLEFLHLYDHDPGDVSMQTNLLSDIDITRDLGNWSNDVDELEKATNGLSPPDVFNRCEQPVASMTLPQLNKEYKENGATLIHGQHPKWKYLTIDSFTPKDSVVAELKGKIGHMQRYIQDPANRWDYLRHPAPFVFFHPKLPIYIDTRSEGTTCRYLRRSCDPNLSMKTFLENGSEYHFCFVAKQDLDAGSELTIGWVLDEHIRNYFSSRSHEDIKIEGDLDEEYVADWVGKVLAEFGGCACNSPDRCALAKYDRRIAASTKVKNGHMGKYSPPDISCATNSRAGSEQDDRRSSESKSQSRDLTPTNHATSDTGFGVGIEISDREKRKIAALEKNFEQLENDKHQPAQKKKKRNSGGSTVNTPSVGTSKQLGHTVITHSQPSTPGLPLKPHYVDASTSRKKSRSPTMKISNAVGRPRNNLTNARKAFSQPNTPLASSPSVRQNYVNSSMQTEIEEEDPWYHFPPSPHLVKKPYISLTKRLLLRSQQDRAKLEERRADTFEHNEGTIADGAGVIGPSCTLLASKDVDTKSQDPESAYSLPRKTVVEDTNLSTTCLVTQRDVAVEMKPPPPLPITEQSRPINGYRSSDLQMQLPTKPSLSLEPAPNAPLVETPTSTIPQSPVLHNSAATPSSFPHPSSGLVQPSPVKKKVSLGEYFSRRKGSQPVAEMQSNSSPTMPAGNLKPPPLTNGLVREEETEASAAVDTPKVAENDPIEQDGGLRSLQ